MGLSSLRSVTGKKTGVQASWESSLSLRMLCPCPACHWLSGHSWAPVLAVTVLPLSPQGPLFHFSPLLPLHRALKGLTVRCLNQGLTNFSCKGSVVNILGSMSHTVFVTATQLCHRRTEAATENMGTNGHGCVSIKLYLWMLPFDFHSFLS